MRVLTELMAYALYARLVKDLTQWHRFASIFAVRMKFLRVESVYACLDSIESMVYAELARKEPFTIIHF